MEISPFFSQKNGDFSILFFLVGFFLFLILSLKNEKNGEISILFRKEWRYLHSFFFGWIFSKCSNSNQKKLKSMEISPFFSEKNGDFSILFL